MPGAEPRIVGDKNIARGDLPRINLKMPNLQIKVGSGFWEINQWRELKQISDLHFSPRAQEA